MAYRQFHAGATTTNGSGRSPLIVEQEIVTAAELEARMAELARKHAKVGRKISAEKIVW